MIIDIYWKSICCNGNCQNAFAANRNRRNRRGGLLMRNFSLKKKRIYIALLIFTVIVAALAYYYSNKPEPEQISYNTFMSGIKDKKIDKVLLYDDEMLEGFYKNGEKFITDNPRREGLKEELLMAGIKVDEMQQRMQLEKAFGTAALMIIFGA